MQKDLNSIEEAGIQVVGISYDSTDILKKFAAKQQIKFPLLSDADSDVIKKYGILNQRARGRSKGVPHPGTFVIDTDGKVKAYLPGTVVKRHPTKDLIEAANKLKK